MRVATRLPVVPAQPRRLTGTSAEVKTACALHCCALGATQAAQAGAVKTFALSEWRTRGGAIRSTASRGESPPRPGHHFPQWIPRIHKSRAKKRQVAASAHPAVESVVCNAHDYLHIATDAVAEWFAANSFVLGASASASLKLLILVQAVNWMMSTGRLDRNVASVLSKVGFNLIIPCMLLSKLSITLLQDSTWALAGVPLAALLQVVAGAIYGKFAGMYVIGGSSLKLPTLGLTPKASTPAAVSIAASTAAAMSIPQAAPMLVPKPKEPPKAMQTVVQLSCAFGNTVTLPLVFILALLPAAAADNAVAFIALFLTGWSPCLWSIGYQIVGKASGKEEGEPSSTVERPAAYSAQPSLGDARSFSAASTTIDVTEEEEEPVQRSSVPTLGSIYDAVVGFMTRYLNPPLVGVLAGLFLGLSPVGRFFLQQYTASSVSPAGSFPIEVTMLLEICKAGMDVIVMLGGATLAVQGIVLAASMPLPGNKPQSSENSTPKAEGVIKLKKKAAPPGWWRLVFPSDPLERRCVLAVTFVRMLLMPLTGIALLKVLLWVGALPLNPLCQFVILLQSAMPSAQNLVLLMALREETQVLAGDMALLLLRLYILSILPVTLWITYFISLSGLSTLVMA